MLMCPADVFRTNRKDPNISDTSSYLDLAPLYGKNLEEINEVRTFVGGRLRPDTFAEKRLIGSLPSLICPVCLSPPACLVPGRPPCVLGSLRDYVIRRAAAGHQRDAGHV